MPAIERALDAAGPWRQKVISNKQGGFVRLECDRLRWSHRFACDLGAGDAEADKPALAAFQKALDALAMPVHPESGLFGDTGLDMQATRAWGCQAVLLGDALHNGGIAPLEAAGQHPHAHFVDAHALAEYLRKLAISCGFRSMAATYSELMAASVPT